MRFVGYYENARWKGLLRMMAFGRFDMRLGLWIIHNPHGRLDECIGLFQTEGKILQHRLAGFEYTTWKFGG